MRIVVIGGGPSGLMCASVCGQNANNKVFLLDGNEKLGKKLYITGKGRCNVTNLCERDEFLRNVVRNGKFLFATLSEFSPKDAVEFLESNGLKTKTERGRRVFPMTDKASDVTRVFERILERQCVKVLLNTHVRRISKTDSGFVVFTHNDEILCEQVVLATGGMSYPLTGSTGDGLKFARDFSHNIIQPKPALVGIELRDYDGENLSGLTLKNIQICVELSSKTYSQFGEMLFTHKGVSGPAVLTLSSIVSRENISGATLMIDLKPAITKEELHARLIKDFANYKTKILKNYLHELLPSSLIMEFILKGKFDGNLRVCDISRDLREKIIDLIKNFSYNIKKPESFDGAIITSGGVDVSEINPKNMQSKMVKNLFFVGEVLDLDAFTGGFNIHIALATGYMAGKYLRDNGAKFCAKTFN